MEVANSAIEGLIKSSLLAYGAGPSLYTWQTKSLYLSKHLSFRLFLTTFFISKTFPWISCPIPKYEPSGYL